MTLLPDAELADLLVQCYTDAPNIQPADNVRAVFYQTKDEFIVAIPGTTDIAGWLRDFDTEIDWIQGLGPLHKGFGTGGLMLWNACFNDILASGKFITYIGHSLGGALALVMAALHAKGKWPVCRVMTCGAPRVPICLNPYFVYLVHKAKSAVEYRREGDPVPDVPFWPLFVGTARQSFKIGKPISLAELSRNHAIKLYADDLHALASK